MVRANMPNTLFINNMKGVEYKIGLIICNYLFETVARENKHSNKNKVVYVFSNRKMRFILQCCKH